MKLGLGLGFGRNGGSGFWILLGGAYGGSFNETTGTAGVIGTATTNLSGTLTWSIVAGGDADISINSSTGAVSSARAIYSGDSAAFTVQVTNGTLTIGFPFTATGTVSAYESEASALFARFTSDPGSTRKGHINTLIAALKSASVWTKLDALYILAAHDSQAACRNWIADSYNLTATNSPTFTTDRGYTGNGSNAYLETGFNPATASSPKYVQDSASIGVWCIDNTTDANGYAIGLRGASTASLNPRSTSANTLRGTINKVTNIFNFGSNTTADGLSVLCRTSSTAMAAFRNGATNGTVTGQASTAVSSVPMAILMANAAYSSHQVAVGLIGQDLSATDNTNLYNALNTYLVAVGAA